MSVKWMQTKYKSVRYYESDTKRNGVRKDRYYAIRFMGWIKDKRTGETKWGQKDEGLGWESEGWTAEKAALELANIKKAKTTGEGAQSLKEKREKAMAKHTAEEEEAAKLEREKTTFSHFFTNIYLPIAKTHKKKQTYTKEELHFNLWINPVFGNKPIKDIKPFDIERLKKKLLDAGRSPRTVQYILATTRQVWNMARRDGIISIDSPTKSVKVPKVDNKRQRFLTMNEEKQLLEKMKTKNLQDYHITLLSLRTGMRASEVFNLKWNCVDIKNGRIMVLDGKGDKSRVAFMTEDVKAMFVEMGKTFPKDYVFKNTKGGKYNEVSNTFALKVKELKLNDDATDRRQHVCFHTCRHTFASRLAESGVDLYTIKTLLGHSTIALTERYSHLTEGTLQGAIRTLDRNMKKANAI
jgi:integrase